MNILLVSKISNDESYKTSRMELLKALKKRGHNTIITKGKSLKEPKKEEEGTIYIPTVAPYRLSGILYGLYLFFTLPFLIYKKKIQVVLIDGNTIYLPFILSLKILRIPLILDIRSLPVWPQGSLLFNISIFISKYVANAYTTITPELKNFLINKYDIDKEIGIWSSGVSIENFNPSSKEKNEMDIYRDKFTLMYHGSYSPKRGIENLLLSLKEIRDKSILKDLKIVILGFKKEHIAKLSEFCKKKNISTYVSFIEPIEYKRISRYVSKCTIGIIPLPPENEWWRVSSPLKTLEYMAMEKPIIATNIPFHKEIFEKGECGYLIEDGSSITIAKAIEEAYKNRRNLEIMGKEGRKIIEHSYTWNQKALELEQFIKNNIYLR